MPTPLPVSPTIATIDQNNVLTINWNPPTVAGGYTLYQDFNIFLGTPQTNYPGTIQLLNGQKPTGLEFPGATADTRIFKEQLIQADYGLNMQAEPTDTVNYSNSPKFNASDLLFAFPSPLLNTQVTLDNTTLELGQTVTVTLANTYPQSSAGAQFWQVYWPDNTTTGALPLTTRSAAKAFTTPGALNIVIKTWNDYSSATPAVKLYRELVVPIFVVDQQFNPTASSTQGSLTSTLGFGGETLFEVVDATGGGVTPEPYEVIARLLARDTVNNELKLVVLTSRFANASSELATMALDAFPLPGRPHSIDLVEPSMMLETTAQTTSSPVKITTSTLPTVIVGKAMPQFKLSASGGINNYTWSNDGTLPPGLNLSVDGTISGTPTQLGTFAVNFSVADNGTPNFIADITLNFSVQTDLVITTSSIPNMTVLSPYSQQLAYSGGLAPYTWEIAAGALPVGISIDPATGTLQGTPCTYNSHGDYYSVSGKTWTATIQITDAIGAKATKTYTVQLAPANLQVGPIDQGQIFATQNFKLAVPIFGGLSPYSNLVISLDGTQTSESHSLVDGTAEINILYPNTATGVHPLGIQIKDSGSYSVTALSDTKNFSVATGLSNARVVEAFFNHYWDTADAAAVSLNIIGSLDGYLLEDQALALANGLAGAVSSSALNATVTGPATSFRNAEIRFPITLLQGDNPIASISRTYTLLAHDDTAAAGDVGVVETFSRPYIVGDFVGLNPRKPYYNSPDAVGSFTPAPGAVPLTVRVQSASALPPGLSLDQNTGLIYGYLKGIYTVPSVLEYVDGSGLVHGTVTITWNTVNSDFLLVDNNVLNNLAMGTVYSGGSALIAFTAPAGITMDSVSVYSGTLPSGMAVQLDNTGQNVLLTGAPNEAGYFDVWFRATSGAHASYIAHRVSVDYVTPLAILTTSLPAISAQAYSTTLQGFGGLTPYTWSSPQFPGGTGTGAFAGLTLVTNANGSGTIAGTLSSPPGSSPTDLGNIVLQLSDSRGATVPPAVTTTLDLTYDNRLRIVTPSNGIPTIPTDATDYAFNMVGAGGVPPYTWKLDTSPTLPSGITFDALAPAYGTGAFSGSTTQVGYNQTVTIHLKDSAATEVSGTFTVKTGTPALAMDTSGAGAVPRGVAYQGRLKVINGTSSPVTPINIWQISPTVSHPNGLLSGLSLAIDSTTLGIQAIISGTYNGVPHTTHPAATITNVAAGAGIATITAVNSLQVGDTVVIAGLTNAALNGTWTVVTSSGTQFTFASSATIASTPDSGTATGQGYQVRIVAVDNAGNSAVGLVSLNTVANLVQITTTSLPNATVGGSYSFQLVATGGVPPYTFAATPTFPFHGLSMSSSGLITGAAADLFSQTFNFVASDSFAGIGGANTSASTPLTLTSQAAGLTITTAQTDFTANPPVAGRAYTFTLQAAGDANQPYTWSISPLSANQLPTGLSLTTPNVTPTTTSITGTTNLVGFSKPVTFRCTDSIGAFVDKTFTITVNPALALKTGIDFADGTSTNSLGYVVAGLPDTITPRPNLSFYVIATGVISTNPTQMQVNVGIPGVIATVTQITGGNAYIKLSGNGFNQAGGSSPVNYNVPITVIDSGVTVSGTFTWSVYNNGQLRLVATNNLPTQTLV